MNRILITGGNGVVGHQLVTHFLKQGNKVFTTTRSKNRFLSTCDPYLKDHKNLYLIETDFMNSDSVNHILTTLDQVNAEIDTVIHNARDIDNLQIEKDGNISDRNFANELYLALIFPYKLTMELYSKGASLTNVIFISSMYGVVAPQPKLYDDFIHQSPIHYGTAKAGQIHLSKELAVRLAPRVRVNCISFGGIKGRTSEEFYARYKAFNPQSKMLTKTDLAEPVDFLVSNASENITGHNLVVDNGWTIW